MSRFEASAHNGAISGLQSESLLQDASGAVIESLARIEPADLRRIASSGYATREKYAIILEDFEDGVDFRMQRVALEQQYVKQYEPCDDETLELYQKLSANGFSFAAMLPGAIPVGVNSMWMLHTATRAWAAGSWRPRVRQHRVPD